MFEVVCYSKRTGADVYVVRDHETTQIAEWHCLDCQAAQDDDDRERLGYYVKGPDSLPAVFDTYQCEIRTGPRASSFVYVQSSRPSRAMELGRMHARAWCCADPVGVPNEY